MNESPSDRRLEPRRSADGEVTLLVEEADPQRFQGRLMDISNSGFRAMHQCRTLAPGDVVSFVHRFGAGEARVVWRRVHPENPTEIECGFYVPAGR